MKLEDIRDKIDEIDENIVKLYEERNEVIQKVIESKKSTGKNVYDPIREKQKLEYIKGICEEKSIQDVQNLMTTIMALSRKNQYKSLISDFDMLNYKKILTLVSKKSKVLFQGNVGGYGYQAMKKYFGDYGIQESRESFDEVFKDINNGNYDYAVLPIENSTAGEVTQVYDLLSKYRVNIVDMFELDIKHVLIAKKGTTLKDINTIYSHPQAFMQCSTYLKDKNYIKISVENTALATQIISNDNTNNTASIASRHSILSDELYVLDDNISNNDKNITKFIVITKNKAYLPKSNNILVSFRLKDEVGSLHQILNHIIYNNLNMTKIFSRPNSSKKWNYNFFINFKGSIEDDNVQSAIYGMSEESDEFNILGVYPN